MAIQSTISQNGCDDCRNMIQAIGNTIKEGVGDQAVNFMQHDRYSTPDLRVQALAQALLNLLSAI